MPHFASFTFISPLRFNSVCICEYSAYAFRTQYARLTSRYPLGVASSNRLRELRLDRAKVAPAAFTLGALASRLGVDQSTLWRWERGVQQPTRRHLRALAREFAVAVEDLGLTIRPPDGES
jgi:hypothetical protein